MRLEITGPRVGSLDGKFQSFVGGRSGKLQAHRTVTTKGGARLRPRAADGLIRPGRAARGEHAACGQGGRPRGWSTRRLALDPPPALVRAQRPRGLQGSNPAHARGGRTREEAPPSPRLGSEGCSHLWLAEGSGGAASSGLQAGDGAPPLARAGAAGAASAPFGAAAQLLSCSACHWLRGSVAQ
jgi:hypothetical protein